MLSFTKISICLFWDPTQAASFPSHQSCLSVQEGRTVVSAHISSVSFPQATSVWKFPLAREKFLSLDPWRSKPQHAPQAAGWATSQQKWRCCAFWCAGAAHIPLTLLCRAPGNTVHNQAPNKGETSFYILYKRLFTTCLTTVHTFITLEALVYLGKNIKLFDSNYH